MLLSKVFISEICFFNSQNWNRCISRVSFYINRSLATPFLPVKSANIENWLVIVFQIELCEFKTEDHNSEFRIFCDIWIISWKCSVPINHSLYAFKLPRSYETFLFSYERLKSNANMECLYQCNEWLGDDNGIIRTLGIRNILE